MIAGSITNVTIDVASTTPDTIVSASGALISPGGTVSSITATVGPAGSGLLHQISMLVSTPLAGGYLLTTSANMASGEVKVNAVEYFASFIDTNSVVRDRLQIDNTIVPDKVIDRCIKTTASMLESRYVPQYIKSYGAVPIVDRQQFDMAMAILSAAYLRPFLPKTTPTGDLISNKIGPDEFKYADINAHAIKPLDPLEIRWFLEAQSILDNLQFLAPDVLSDSSIQLFVAVGQRRVARRYFSIPSTQPDYDIWGDVVTRYEWSRNFVTLQL